MVKPNEQLDEFLRDAQARLRETERLRAEYERARKASEETERRIARERLDRLISLL